MKTGQVTYAVRDTVIDDKEIKQGNIMGIGDIESLSACMLPSQHWLTETGSLNDS